MKNYIIAIALLLSFTACGVERIVSKGDKYMALGEYYDAAAEYKKAYSRTPPKEREKRGERALKLAQAYELSLQSQKSIGAYRNAVRYNKTDNGDRLAYARLLLKNGEYNAALQEFSALIDSMPDNKLARAGLESATLAQKMKSQGSRYNVKRMEIFNSRRADYSPMLYGDDYDQVYFTSTRNEADGTELSGITGTKAPDIFVSQKDDRGRWQKPEQVQGGLNTSADEGTPYFSPDGREMFISYATADPTYPRYATIAVSQRADAVWGKPTEVKLSNDTLSAFAHPAISPDGNWIYFVSDMPGGYGGKDIWRARITANGSYGGVENLGSQINTEGDEMFPTFRKNGDLYFSSNGHSGMGGLDIFIAHPEHGNRYRIEHPGFPLNSQGDDFGMTFEGNHNRGFFSSNRGDARGFDHIYSFECPEIIQTVTGWVYEQDGYELHAAEVYIIGTDGTNQRMSVKSDGSFSYRVNDGVDYLFLATCQGYLNHKEELSVLPTEESKEHVLQFALPSVTAPVVVENVFYDFDRATLREESSVALDKLVKLLEENPNITIELSAHTDHRGSDAYNKRLSQARAESCVQYLIAKGIAPERLTPVGYGEEKPKEVRRKLTEKIDWLKENDILNEEYISALDAEKQEVCHQLNRRTEFQVLSTTYGMFDEKGSLKKEALPKKVEKADDIEFFDIE